MRFMTRHKKLIKVLIAMLIILTVFNFLCPNVKADKADEMEEIAGSGTSIGSVVDGILGVLLIGERAHLTFIGKAMDLVLMAFNDFERMDVSKILFNHVELTNINFFDIDGASTDVIKTLRTSIASWYTGIRNVAAALLIIICIYVGIRLAMALTGEEKAKYKQMLVDWITGVALLFVLHYAMLLVIAFNNSVVKAIEDGLLAGSGMDSINDLSEQFFTFTWVDPDGGFQWSFMAGTTNAVLYIMLKLMTLVFLIMYIKRMVTIGFLIVIAPLVTITYSIDKISDGKAQGMNTWFREFAYNVLIQPFQCIIFAALVSIASALANTATVTSGFMALFLLIFIFEAEKLIKHVFHIQSSTLGDAIASAALAASVAQKSMAFADQAKGKVKSKIAANSKTRPEFKKQKQSQTYMKLKEGKHTKKLAPLYRKKIQTEKKISKGLKSLDSKINGNRGLRIGRSIGRGAYRLVSGANNIVVKGAMGFAIAGAMGQDEVAVGTALHQGFKAGEENLNKEKAYYAGAQKHKIARNYNDLKDEALEQITQDYYASGKNVGKTPAQQAEEIDKIFNDKVMDLFSGAVSATSAKESKLLASMKDYGIFLAAQGKGRDEQFDELEKIIDGIDSGNIGELWSGDDAGGLGVVPTYQLGEINKGAGRSHKTIIHKKILAAKEKDKNASGAQIAAEFKRTKDGEGIIKRDAAERAAEEEAADREFFKSLDIEDEKRRGLGKGKK